MITNHVVNTWPQGHREVVPVGRGYASSMLHHERPSRRRRPPLSVVPEVDVPAPPPVEAHAPTPVPTLVATIPLLNRELSWLAFNERVLEEAADERWPLLERLKFLA